MKSKNIVLLMMGGIGTRVGAPIPKQFLEYNGKPIFAYIMEALHRAEDVSAIVIVTYAEWMDYVAQWKDKLHCNKVYGIVPGGASRSESVLAGLDKAKEIANDDDIVMMHDASHPYVDEIGMHEMIEAVRIYGGATMAQRQYDTCYTIGDDDIIREVIPRQIIVSGASPEAFRFGQIYSIYKNASIEELNKMTSAGAIALAHGIKMKVCTLHSLNLKLTFPEDMVLLDKLLTTYFFEEKN